MQLHRGNGNARELVTVIRLYRGNQLRCDDKCSIVSQVSHNCYAEGQAEGLVDADFEGLARVWPDPGNIELSGRPGEGSREPGYTEQSQGRGERLVSDAHPLLW